jgi:hypothetical protein
MAEEFLRSKFGRTHHLVSLYGFAVRTSDREEADFQGRASNPLNPLSPISLTGELIFFTTITTAECCLIESNDGQIERIFSTIRRLVNAVLVCLRSRARNRVIP